MEIKIIFDNNVQDESFAVGWGFSCLVDHTIFSTPVIIGLV
jgi:metal-dependent hydrolase (beta-lactamase superfamily II)